jgi:hypothetical protein
MDYFGGFSMQLYFFHQNFQLCEEVVKEKFLQILQNDLKIIYYKNFEKIFIFEPVSVKNCAN